MAWLSGFKSITGVRPVHSSPDTFRAEFSTTDLGDFEFNLLLVILDDQQEVFAGDIPWVVEVDAERNGKSAAEQLQELLNELVPRMEQTY